MEAVEESRKEDPFLAAKKADIERQLFVLDDTLKEVNSNFTDVEQKILQVTP